MEGDPFLPGRAQALVIRSPDQIQIEESLKKAEQKYVKEQHQLAFIRQKENANTHPVVNYSGMGVPVMYGKELQPYRTFVSKISPEKPLVACVQTGHLALGATEDCLSPGYAVHPARVALSVSPDRLPASFQKPAELPQEIKSLLMQMRSMETEAVAAQALKGHIPTVERKVEGKRATLVYTAIEGLNRAVKRALGEMKAAKEGSPTRLQKLLLAKVVEKLFTQPHSSSSLGQFSTVMVDPHLKDLEEILTYQQQFDFPATFSEEILDSHFILNVEQAKVWSTFLTQIELSHHRGEIAESEVARFKEMLTVLREMNLLPLWMIRFFLPQKVVLKDLLADFDSQSLQKIKEDMELIRTFNLDSFGDPDLFEKAWSHLQAISKKIEADLERHPSSITRLCNCQMMGALIDLFDSAIKRMKASTAYSDEKKVALFSTMLEPYFGLFIRWTEKYTQNLLGDTGNLNLEVTRYLAVLEETLVTLKQAPSSKQLTPSPGYNVAAAVLGNQTSLTRALPKTLEDAFSLIHQNLLKGVQVLLNQEMRGEKTFPPLVEGLMQGFSDSQLPLQITGYSFPEQQMAIRYNYPMRNHSAIFDLLYDKETRSCSQKVQFLGEGITHHFRWQLVGQILKQLNRAGLLLLEHEPEISDLGISYTLKLTSAEEVQMACKMMKAFADYAFSPSINQGLWGLFSSLDKLEQPSAPIFGKGTPFFQALQGSEKLLPLMEEYGFNGLMAQNAQKKPPEALQETVELMKEKLPIQLLGASQNRVLCCIPHPIYRPLFELQFDAGQIFLEAQFLGKVASNYSWKMVDEMVQLLDKFGIVKKVESKTVENGATFRLELKSPEERALTFAMLAGICQTLEKDTSENISLFGALERAFEDKAFGTALAREVALEALTTDELSKLANFYLHHRFIWLHSRDRNINEENWEIFLQVVQKSHAYPYGWLSSLVACSPYLDRDHLEELQAALLHRLNFGAKPLYCLNFIHALQKPSRLMAPILFHPKMLERRHENDTFWEEIVETYAAAGIGKPQARQLAANETVDPAIRDFLKKSYRF